MKKMLIVTCAAVSFSAFAQAPAPKAAPAAAPAPMAAAAAPAPMMDITKMGAPSRKPTDEKKTKKEVEEFIKRAEMVEDKGDEAAKLSLFDFPIYMATDDMKGMTSGMPVSKDEYLAMMKPMEGSMKDIKSTHKPTITVLSDSLVNVVDDFTMTQGKTKAVGRNASLLVKVGGEWKWKSMVEAGWGGMMGSGDKNAMAPAAGSTMAPAPAAKSPASTMTPPPANTAAPAPAPKK